MSITKFRRIQDILASKYPPDVIEDLIRSYKEIRTNYCLRKYKASELEGGFFVECVRRILYLELFNRIIPLGHPLPKFDHNEIGKYAAVQGKDVAFTLLIPRVLWSIYTVRNQRGAAHVSPVSPNKMDSAYAVAACKWVLAELVRQVSFLPPGECQAIVDELIEKDVQIVWNDGNVKRVLDTKLTSKEKVLVLLYTEDGNTLSDADLRRFIEYKNFTEFRKKVLQQLHNSRLLEYRDGKCQLTPRGILEAEKIIAKALS